MFVQTAQHLAKPTANKNSPRHPTTNVANLHRLKPKFAVKSQTVNPKDNKLSKYMGSQLASICREDYPKEIQRTKKKNKTK